MAKRLFDLVLSAMGIVLLSPLLLILAWWIKLDSPGPVLYRGVRVGLGGRPFHLLKFRTMVADADRGPSSAGDDDPRITRVGRFLRAHKLDELPQLLNVIAGEMSLVGPRPQVRWAVDRYTQAERALLTVRPGITDHASLAFRNEGELLRGAADPDGEYLRRIAPHKIRLGLHYVHHHSLWSDCRILLATLGTAVGIDPAWCLPPPDTGHPPPSGGGTRNPERP
jgi:lipopolysaccharide/colanic/teichoic acid biosynthesis glycosyltransferase